MERSGARFIVFEGLDGSGKSTCAAEVARRIGAELMTTPSPRVRRYRDDLIDALGESQEARQLFYLATVFAASREVEKLLALGRSVVLDRYFLSTQAYAAFRGSQVATHEVDVVERFLVPAHLTVYLDTSLAVRVERLRRRGMSEADLETMTVAADQRLREEHERRSRLGVVGRWVRVEGGGEVDEVAERVCRALRDFES